MLGVTPGSLVLAAKNEFRAVPSFGRLGTRYHKEYGVRFQDFQGSCIGPRRIGSQGKGTRSGGPG